MRSIHDNLQAIRERIAHAATAAGRSPDAVTLLAVSKTHPAALVREALDAGQTAFGENYVQEAIEKMDELAAAAPAPQWHLIGPLQSNKTRLVAGRFGWVQSVDGEKIARRLSGQRSGNLPPLNVLLQVNVSGEPTKSGVAPSEAPALAAAVARLPRLRLRGLMAIPEPGAPRAQYRELKSLFDRLKDGYRLDTLSVGMSGDLEVAIEEGSTMVRVGTAIFGERAKREPSA